MSEGAERLAALATKLLAERPGRPEHAIGDLAAVRSEIDRIAAAREAAGGEAKLLPEVRRALGGAGLGDVAPEGAPLAAIQAGLARLHGLLAALAATGRKKRRSKPRP